MTWTVAVVPADDREGLELEAWRDLVDDDLVLDPHEGGPDARMDVTFAPDGADPHDPDVLEQKRFVLRWADGRVEVDDPEPIVLGKMAWVARKLGPADLVDEDGVLDPDEFLSFYLAFLPEEEL